VFAHTEGRFLFGDKTMTEVPFDPPYETTQATRRNKLQHKYNPLSGRQEVRLIHMQFLANNHEGYTAVNGRDNQFMQALVKRGLVFFDCGRFLLTDSGKALVKTFNLDDGLPF
jgi:hypothetical protein